MTSRAIIRLIRSGPVAAREQGYRLVVARYARSPIPTDVVEVLMERFAEGPPWSDGLISALLCGHQTSSMPVLVGILEKGTVEQRRKAIAELWHRQPEGSSDDLRALLGRIAKTTGTLAFDAANVLASTGDMEAGNRLVELIVATDGKPESLRHYALETLSPELRSSVDAALEARGMITLQGPTPHVGPPEMAPKVNVVLASKPEQGLRALMMLRSAFGASVPLSDLQRFLATELPLVLLEGADEAWARSVLIGLSPDLAACVALRKAGAGA